MYLILLFYEEQNRYADKELLYQDNKNGILLMNNCIYSAGKGSKEIHVRYYLITDRIKKGDFKIMYCPTEEMIADNFTKLLRVGFTILQVLQCCIGYQCR